MNEALVDAVRGLLERARDAATDDAARAALEEASRRLDGPLRLAIAGRVKAGKSTLLNALVGEELAPTDAGECTRVVTWYVGADQPGAVVHHTDGTSSARPYRRSSGPIEVDLGVPAEEVERLEIRWPSSRLRDVTLIDTPGIASLSTEVSARVSVLFADDEGAPSVADAVLYLLRHAHASDIRFLESFHDDELAKGTPVNAVGVLSRADEIGSCRLDALEVADRIARRYSVDDRMRRLCPLVIPVAGLLGQAGVTLREDEFRALARIAALPVDDAGELLLTAARFGAEDGAGPVRAPITQLERQHLLDRLGLFGVRFAVELIRAGSTPSASLLAPRLTADGGLDRLRSVLVRQFTERSRLLQTRSALAVLRAVARGGGLAEATWLESAIEEVTSSAHDLVEVRLLNALRSGALELPEADAEALDRLLGGRGHGPAERLALDPDAGADELRAAALATLARWQRLAESPLAAPAVRNAARSAVRTCEGILAGL